jgi:hypothetical protein
VARRPRGSNAGHHVLPIPALDIRASARYPGNSIAVVVFEYAAENSDATGFVPLR